MLPLFVSVLLASLSMFNGASVVDIVSSIARAEHALLLENLEVCFIQLRDNSKRGLLDDTMRVLLKELASNYPTTIANQHRRVLMFGRKDASLVIVDAIGYGAEFPFAVGLKRFDTHECYSQSAKFIIFVDLPTNRTMVAFFFKELGLVNYLVIPIDAKVNYLNSTIGTLYTKNQFTNEEFFFDVRDNDNSNERQRFFPEKLLDIRGYEFLTFGLHEFPYMFYLSNKQTAGLLIESLRHLIVEKLNGTLRMARDHLTTEDRPEFDLTFAFTDFRAHHMHVITLKERSGHCVLCPLETERDFLRHLLQPFSLGIWLVLGGLVGICPLLGWLFPRWFQRNLLEQIFFTASTPHQLPFPTRIVSFGAAVLIFFLSEAYNAKIISLMSVSKYHEQPTTVSELQRSAYKIAIPGVRASLIAEVFPGKLLSSERAKAIYREQGERMFREYCTVTYCYMATLQVAQGHNQFGFQQYVLRDLLLQKVLMLQLASRSPFHRTFVEFYERYFQSGIWMHRLDWMNNKLQQEFGLRRNRLEEVVFHFDDLGCIWVLILVGWLLSVATFTIELLWAHVKFALCKAWQRVNRIDWLRHRPNLRFP